MEDYPKRLVELYEVLKYMSEEDKAKLPQDLKDAIENGRDENYTWNYDESKSLAEQDLHPDTVAMLTYINMEYILTDEQKENVKSALASNKKKNKVNNDLKPQEIHMDFDESEVTEGTEEENKETEDDKNTEEENEKSKENDEETGMVASKKHESIFKKIVHFFMDIFINSDYTEN